MRAKRIRLALIVLLLVPLALTGCWDRTEVNDIAIVVASSIDLEGDGLYRVSVQVPLPGQLGGASGGGGGTSGEKSYYVDSAVGSTVREANAKVQRRMSRRLFYAHRRVLVIGEDLAREMGIRQLFDVITRVPENRMTANMAIAKGKGYDLLNAQPRFERYSSEAMREILEGENVVNVTMKDVGQLLSKRGADAILPYMQAVKSEKGEKNSTETEFVGYAQFHGGKMVNVLEGPAVQGVHWRQQFRPYVTTIHVDKIGPVSVNVYKGNVNVKPVLMADHIHFEFDVVANSYLIETLSEADFDLEVNVRQVEQALAKAIKVSIQEMVDSMQKYDTDSEALGLIISRDHPREWKEKYSKDWYAELRKATFSINAKAVVERVGLVSRNPAAMEGGK